MLETVLVALTLATTNQNSILDINQPVQTVQQEVQPPPEPTIEEKIASNFYKCNTDTQWIRKDNAQCLDKPSTTAKVSRASVSGNTYTPGNCTWYVKNTLSWVPNGLGNADQWAYRAPSYGLTVSSTPVVGSVAASRYGMHVAVVTAISGGMVTVSEMNVRGLYVVSTRTAPAANYVFIY